MTLMLDRADPLSAVLTLDQAAQAAGVTRRTINRWITEGRLTVLPGRRVVERQVLQVERATRHAARRGRPGPRVRMDMLT